MKKNAFILMFLMLILPCAYCYAVEAQEPVAPPSFGKQESAGQAESPFSTHKTNYFAFYGLPWKDYAQIKFQFSAKYKFFNHEVDLWGVQSALFFAYTQKSFWSIGQASKPFEESNYNPEVFFRFRPALQWGRIKLREILISPYEHESNGMAGAVSRSWDRRYVEVRVGLQPATPYEKVEAFTDSMVELDLKGWHASGFGDQDAYLRSIGSALNFLDYAGKGELRLKVRNIIPWPWDNQFSFSTRLYQAHSIYNYEFEFQQKIPGSAFSFYIQNWKGYDESLLRFDRDQNKFYTGFSFSY